MLGRSQILVRRSREESVELGRLEGLQLDLSFAADLSS